MEFNVAFNFPNARGVTRVGDQTTSKTFCEMELAPEASRDAIVWKTRHKSSTCQSCSRQKSDEKCTSQVL